MGNRRVRHNRFFKVLTICGATLGLVAATAFSVFLGLDMTGANPFITNKLRTYHAKFTNCGAVISDTTYQRGELIEIPKDVKHDIDGESNYFFLGWDTTGNGLLDIVPPRIQYSFTADAVYLRTGKFNLNWLDLANMDLEQLLELLDMLGIDWMQFMDMFGIDPETLLNWLNEHPVAKFTASDSRYVSYFRGTSYGDYNFSRKQLDKPSFYDSSRISEGSVNPLSYTADKLHSAYAASDVLPSDFDFIDYDIEFLAKQDYYPVPDCEYPTGDEGKIDSDAHYLTKPIDNKYQAQAAYIPAKKEVINLLKLAVPYSNNAIANDEKEYTQYAIDNYTTIPKEYEEIIDGIIAENDWYEKDYTQVDEIGHYVENLGAFNLFNDEGEFNYELLKVDKNKDPVRSLIENKQGTDQDFNITAMMIFRRLNIPARIVEGYLKANITPGENVILLTERHYWCEIYVPRIGWMICDCTNFEQILGTNIYGDVDKEDNPVEDDLELDHIEVTPPQVTKYRKNELFDLTGMKVDAFYTDGSQSRVQLSDCKFDRRAPDELGEHEIPVSYTYKEVTKEDSFTITVEDREAEIVRVVFDTDEAKKQYLVNQTFSSEGVKATVYYDDDTTAEYDDKVINVDSTEADMSQAGEYNIYLSLELQGETYRDKYTISVRDEDFTDVEVTHEPTKTTYYAGENFDPTGLVVTLTTESGAEITAEPDEYEITGVSSTDMKTPGTHEVTVTYSFTDHNGNDVVLEDTFEIEIIDNPVTQLEYTGYKNSYQVGDYFDFDEFKEDMQLVVHNEHGDPTPLEGFDPADVELVSAPDLSGGNTATVRVSYEIDGQTYETDLEISLGKMSDGDFALSNKISTSGPGEMENPVDVFKVNTTQMGTMYMKTESYADYSNAEWSNPQRKDQSDDFAYEKGSGMYVNKSVTVTYLMNLKQGISPVYSPYLESATEAKTNGDSDTYTYTMFDPSNYDHTYRRLTEYVDFKTATQTRYNSYVSTVKNTITSPYLKTTASSESMEKVDEYIAAKGYGAYDINNPAQRLALIYKIKEDFQTDFTYNIDFHYDATHDPVYSFFTVGEGICGNFATASIMVYRRLGIPARCAMGFGFNSAGGETTVDSTKAHAWTEVWFDNLGWITVDCTGYDDGHELGGGGYGSGFGGGGLYNVPEIVYGGLVNISYAFKEGAEDTYGDFIVPYCGLGYEDLITCNWELDDPNAVLPDYLDIEVYLTGSGDGARIGNYTYTPHIIVRDKVTGDDVTAEFEFEINPAQEDVSYYVDPRVIYVTVSQTGEVHINDLVSLTKQTTGLPEGYTLALWQENFSYSEPGSYTDYSYHIYFVISVSDIYEYYSGHGAPFEGLSTDVELLNGNHYLDLDTGDYYLYKNGVWILLGHDDETILFVVMPTYNPVVVLP